MAKNVFVVFACLALIACGGPAHQPAKKVVPDTSANAPRVHTLVYDSSYCARETDTAQPFPDFSDLPRETQKEIYSTAQYKIWVKRKRLMKQWATQYAMLHLPANARIIDVKAFGTPRGMRTIVAWMTGLEVHLDPGDDPYCCTYVTMGKGYFSGSLHFSLVSNVQNKIINTIRIYSAGTWQRDDTVHYSEECVNYPFSIANPRYRDEIAGLIYHARGGTDTRDGEADIMDLQDLNADGKKYEFGLFIQGSCVGKSSTLIGYNEKEDILKWYQWHVDWKETGLNGKDSAYSSIEQWINEAMICPFEKDGTKNYEYDYRGRGGSVMRYYLRYNKATDTYSGLIDSRELPEDTAIKPSWMPQGRKL